MVVLYRWKTLSACFIECSIASIVKTVGVKEGSEKGREALERFNSVSGWYMGHYPVLL